VRVCISKRWHLLGHLINGLPRALGVGAKEEVWQPAGVSQVMGDSSRCFHPFPADASVVITHAWSIWLTVGMPARKVLLICLTPHKSVISQGDGVYIVAAQSDHAVLLHSKCRCITSPHSGREAHAPHQDHALVGLGLSVRALLSTPRGALRKAL
jgi:hypothetical protein